MQRGAQERHVLCTIGPCPHPVATSSRTAIPNPISGPIMEVDEQLDMYASSFSHEIRAICNVPQMQICINRCNSATNDGNNMTDR